MKFIFIILSLVFLASCQVNKSESERIATQQSAQITQKSTQTHANLLICKSTPNYRSYDIFELVDIKRGKLLLTSKPFERLESFSPSFAQRLKGLYENALANMVLVEQLPLGSSEYIPAIPSSCELAVGVTSENINGQIIYKAVRSAWAELSRDEKFVLLLREILKNESESGDGVRLRNVIQGIISQKMYFQPNTYLEGLRLVGLPTEHRENEITRFYRKDVEVKLDQPCGLQIKDYIYDACSSPLPKIPSEYDLTSSYFYFSIASGAPGFGLKVFGLDVQVKSVGIEENYTRLQLLEPLKISNQFFDMTCIDYVNVAAKPYIIDVQNAKEVVCKLDPNASNAVFFQGAWRKINPVNFGSKGTIPFSISAEVNNKELLLGHVEFTKGEMLELYGLKAQVKEIKSSRYGIDVTLTGQNYVDISGASCELGDKVSYSTISDRKIFTFPKGCKIKYNNQLINITNGDIRAGVLTAFTTTDTIPLVFGIGKKTILLTGEISVNAEGIAESGTLAQDVVYKMGYANDGKKRPLPAGATLSHSEYGPATVDDEKAFILKKPFKVDVQQSESYGPSSLLIKDKLHLEKDGTFFAGILAKDYTLSVYQPATNVVAKQVVKAGTYVKLYSTGYQIEDSEK